MFFGRKRTSDFTGGGLIIFNNVEEAIRAEKVLKQDGYEVKLVAPPPDLRRGCDLALEINLMEEAGIERSLRAGGAQFSAILPVRGTGELLNIVKIKDFGEAIMVKAGNMKLTFDKKTGAIINISGGGCPDIPYLHLSMIDRKLGQVARPKDNGYTLCALMLDRAYTEALALRQKEDN